MINSFVFGRLIGVLTCWEHVIREGALSRRPNHGPTLEMWNTHLATGLGMYGAPEFCTLYVETANKLAVCVALRAWPLINVLLRKHCIRLE